MSNKTASVKDSRIAGNTKSNFGSMGWLMIAYSGLMFYFYAGTATDGLNIIVHNFSHAHQIDVTRLLALTTPASWAGILGAVVWAWFVDKLGTRIGAPVTGILGGLCFMLYGIVDNATGFFIVTALVNFMGMGFCHTVANTLMAKWFPMKKGLALGWATMGQNLASATFIPLLMLFIVKAGLSGSFYIMGGILVLIGIMGWFIIRNNPEEIGCTPDNGTFAKEEIEANLKEIREYNSPMTPKKLVANKQIWQIGIGYGIYILVTVSLISQMIPRLMMGGFEEHEAVIMMTVAAVCGLFGSYLTGWLDQKIGTKKASIIYGLWYLAALFFCIIPATNFTLYCSVFFIGIGIGGIGNLFPSMAASVFGRFDFVRAMGVLNPITGIVRSFAFVIIALGLSRLGGYNGGYAVIAVLDLAAIIIISRIDSDCIGKK